MNKTAEDKYYVQVILDNGKYIVIDWEHISKVTRSRQRLYYFIMILFQELTYHKDSVDLTVNLYKPMKQKLADSLGITLHRTQQIITECVELGLLKKIDRGIYSINEKYVLGGGIDEEL